ncbi:MAG: hypothetical protein GY694_12655 [Gammaproteobacteria bacterium]|nr:hypothetical protein [Gammaproteobacteria bacterium]
MNFIKDELILIIANTRSHSTLLMDMLLSFPCVNLHKSFEIFSQLNINGRRYPKDLENIIFNKNSICIETFKNQFSNIPVLVTENQNTKTNVYIEKIHPHFISTNYIDFFKRAILLFKKIKIIYLIRTPIESLNSFIQYSNANPDWALNKKTPDFILCQYKNIYQLHKVFSGLIIDSNDTHNQDDIFNKLNEFLAPPVLLNNIYEHTKKFKQYNKHMFHLRKEKSPFITSPKKYDLSIYKKELIQADYYFDLMVNKEK